MPLPRFHRLDEQTQTELLSAARAEFVAHGFERSSLNRIIKEAGISKGAMYYYFADKGDLYATVVGRVVSQFEAAIGPAEPFDDADGFWRAIRVAAQRALTFILSEPDHGVLARRVYEHAGGVLDDILRRVNAAAVETLGAGQRVGAVRKDVPLELLARAITGLLVGMDQWFAENFEDLAPAELIRLGDQCLALCQDLVSPKGKPQ